MRYDPKKIEKKWQAQWLREKLYEPDFLRARKPFYNLMMFPYPSAEGLHIGSVRTFTGVDIYGRFKRMQGHDVFEPIGLDGFGIHSENYALKTGKHPAVQSKITEKNFYRQLSEIGNGFAWREKLETHDPAYYTWTQWIFVQLFKHGLAYRKKSPVNWCPSCLTVLADEQASSGACERCGTQVTKKDLEQWFFKITDYADRLLENLKTIDWSEPVKIAQRNWIGKSEGAEIEFPISGYEISKVVLMHGKDTNPTEKWYPWLIKHVEERGVSCIAPYLPVPENPEMEKWISEIDKTKPDKDTVLIGHSRGGVAIMRWLERQPKEKKVKQIILVAANRGDDTKNSLWTGKVYDFRKIKSHCDNFVVLHSRDDERVPFGAGEHIANGLDAHFLVFNDRGHFGKRFPKN